MPVLPNFFIAGAPKAGTTSLFNYLDQHPQIYMSPVKEPNYFASEMRPEHFSAAHRRQIQRKVDALRDHLRSGAAGPPPRGITVEWEDYLRLFRGVKSEKAIGEASVSYLWSKTAPAGIHSSIPGAKIIVILRDPAERAFSQYLQDVGNGHVWCSFGEHIEAAMRREGDTPGVLHPFLEYGLYHEQLRRWLAMFRREDLHVIWYDDFRDHPAEALAGVFRFLGVDDFAPDVSRRYFEAKMPRSVAAAYVLKKLGLWKQIRRVSPSAVVSFVQKRAYRQRRGIVMAPQDRRRLVDYYRPDVECLAALFDRDLSAWLT